MGQTWCFPQRRPGSPSLNGSLAAGLRDVTANVHQVQCPSGWCPRDHFGNKETPQISGTLWWTGWKDGNTYTYLWAQTLCEGISAKTMGNRRRM